MVSRADLQALAQTRLDDAQLLLASQRYSGAYYLAGYAIELGFKAAISRVFLANVIPDKKFVNDIYVHSLSDLAKLAGLKSKLDQAKNAEASFEANWSIVVQWSEASRYEMIDPFKATEMVAAVGDPQTGIFQWVKLNW